jgi:hypothetical protein
MKPIDKLINSVLLGEDVDTIINEAISSDSNGEVDVDIDNPRIDNIPDNVNANIIGREIARSIKINPLPVKEVVDLLKQLGIDSTATLTKMGYDAGQYSSMEDFVNKQAGFLMKILAMIVPTISRKQA